MKCEILSFVGYILLFSFHCASTQLHHALNDVSGAVKLVKEKCFNEYYILDSINSINNLFTMCTTESYSSYPTINSARRAYKKEKNSEINKNVMQTLPWGYSEFSGCDLEFKTAYKFHPIKKSWIDAVRDCYVEGGYLAYPDCPKENRVYHDILKSFNSGGAWLGMSDRAKEGEWITVHQVPVKELSYVNWALTEPNNYGPDGEDCAELYLNGSWYDMSCDKKLFYICKIDLL